MTNLDKSLGQDFIRGPFYYFLGILTAALTQGCPDITDQLNPHLPARLGSSMLVTALPC